MRFTSVADSWTVDLTPQSMIQLIAFDADDTLWHNEHLFLETKERFKALLAEYHSEEWIDERLYATELRNLKHFGYGIKSFTLSMIETAVELTEGRIRGSEIREIIDFAKDMVAKPVDLLDGVEATIKKLASEHELMIITKGDLFDQESKLARSGLGDYFSAVEVVTEKNSSTYESVVRRSGVEPEGFVMVGNSLKSDIIPVVKMGGHAIHVPYDTTWEHERVPEEVIREYSFSQAANITDVPQLVAKLNGRS